jgi:hypothetical protein
MHHEFNVERPRSVVFDVEKEKLALVDGKEVRLDKTDKLEKKARRVLKP